MKYFVWFALIGVSFFSTNVTGQSDTDPIISIDPLESASLAPGIVTISGDSGDDVGISRNKLHIKSTDTNKFWNGFAWVDDWSWFEPEGHSEWFYNIDLDIGSYVVYAWTWDISDNIVRSDLMPFSVGLEDYNSPNIQINPHESASLVPGMLTISGASSDDVGISRNRLYVKNWETNKFWNGSVWVDSWSWFQPYGQTDWFYNIDLGVGSYELYAWTWDTSNNVTVTEQMVFSVGLEDNSAPEIDFDVLSLGVREYGVVSVAGISSDDVGISRNRLHVKSKDANKFWNGVTWADSWAWFEPNGQSEWSYNIDLVAGSYELYAWAWDTSGNVTRAGPYTISVVDALASNELPVATGDNSVVTAGSSVVIDVIENDADLDGVIDSSTVEVFAAAKFGTTTIDPVSGAITYSASATVAAGTLDQFEYTVKDNDGLVSSPAIVNVRFAGCTARVFGLMGQSNARSIGLVPELTGSNVQFAQPTSEVLLSSKVLDNQTFSPYYDEPLGLLDPNPQNGAGVELSLGRCVQENRPTQWPSCDKVVFLKFAVGGTRIEQWLSDGSNNGPYQGYSGFLNSRLDQLQEQYDNVSCENLFWLQGESDGNDADAPLYLDRYEQFISELQQDVCEFEPIFSSLSEITTPPTWVKPSHVELIQSQLTAAGHTVAYGNADAPLRDSVHFSADSMMSIVGPNICQTYQEME